MAFSAVLKRPAGLRASGRASRRPAVSVRASGASAPPPPPTGNEKPVFTPEQWEDAIKATAPGAVPAAAPAAAKALSFGEAMAFSGPAPELVNGRLAMLGVVAALGAEFASGESVLQQLSEATVPIAITFVAFSVASLVPIFKGANPKEAFGPFTPQAELVNGRAAMIGAAALLSIELIKNAALF